MVFRYDVVDFKKINLKEITSFCSDYNFRVKMSVKMDSNGIGIKIYDEDSKKSICTYGVSELTKEEKEKVMGDNYNEEDDIDRIYMLCDHEFFIKAENIDEFKLVYLFAMYISSYTEMLLINLNSTEVITSIKLSEIDWKLLEQLAGQYEIRTKYVPEITKWSEITSKAFKIPMLFWVLLIVIFIIATALALLIMEVWDVTSGWVVGSPYIVAGLGVTLYFARRFSLYFKACEKVNKLDYEYTKELCELFEDRLPKKPSGKKSRMQIITDSTAVFIVPCLLVGSVLIGLDYILIGIGIVCLPWLWIIGLNLFFKPKDDELRKNLFVWLDECNQVEIDDGVVALYFELDEKGDNKWSIQFIGCTKFDLENSMWTKNDACKLNCSKFEFEYSINWEGMETLLRSLMNKYLSEDEKGINLKKYKALSMGFVDGMVSIIYLHPEEKTRK